MLLSDAQIDEKIAMFGREVFDLTEEHITLLRAASVDWHNLEWGAPMIDGKRPYGNGNLHQDIWEELNPESEWNEDYGMPEDWTPAQWEAERERLAALHRETGTALQVVLSAGTFEPGRYISPKYHRHLWRRDAG